MTEKKPREVIFAPGCFDNFEGTQEELQDLIAHIRQMVNDDTILENSRQLTPEEEEEVWKKMQQQEKRQ